MEPQTWTNIHKIVENSAIRLTDDIIVPSYLRSWIYWRDIFRGRVPEYANFSRRMAPHWKWGGNLIDLWRGLDAIFDQSACGLCDGFGTLTEEDGTYFYCLCSIVEKQQAWERSIYNFSSRIERTSIKSLNMRPPVESGQRGKKQLEQFADAVRAAEQFIEYPTEMLVLSGPTGVGKSHLLYSIANALPKISLYIIASDFEDRLRSMLAEGKGSEIPVFMNALKHHPVLLFDDFGIEYSSDWITAKLESLIEFRTRKSHWWNTITVAATNITRIGTKDRYMRDGVSRIGSRLIDREIFKWCPMPLLDYRDNRRNQ